MTKRIFLIILCLFLLFGVCTPALAAEYAGEKTVTIKDPEELLLLAENCRLDTYSEGLTVYLLRDVDLTGYDFESIPIFSGNFCGNGHTISGLRIEYDGSAQGLFRYVTASGVIHDLHVKADIHPGGSRSMIGGFAGKNSGRIQNCSFSGTVSGGDYVGSLVGINTVTGIIEDCVSSGVLQGNHFVGGIAGSNQGVIRRCENNTQIATTPQQNTVSASDITIENITNSEAANTVTDIGGIAGISTGLIRDCKNNADVGYKHMGYNIGGIAGTQSGSIINCENFGTVHGRKEVGGIVGQMEPVTYIEYSTDLFQILKEQLEEMSEMVEDVSANAQGNASGISSGIGKLQGQAETAIDAIQPLIPDAENPEVPDSDSIMAALSTVSTVMGKMPGTINSIGNSVQATISGLTRDLRTITDQITKMGETIDSASETIGGTFQDVSDLDTPELYSGEVHGCVNRGEVLGDLNIGGITGAIAPENDLDIMEDWSENGDSSLNFEGRLRAVVINCENRGAVTGKTRNIGGIVGMQSLGLVKESLNLGNISAANADNVGGISGNSTGYIRNCNAKCRIAGSTCIGGIAGTGTTVSQCHSMVVFDSGSEKIGSILGFAEENTAADPEETDPILENYGYEPFCGIGAIDGISYAGRAETLSVYDFLSLRDLPSHFRKVNITFVFPDGSQKVIPVTLGTSLNRRRIPSLPVVDHVAGVWEGLEDADLDCVSYDLTFHALYSPKVSVLASEEMTDNRLPLLLLDGSFLPGDMTVIQPVDVNPELTKNQLLLGGWEIAVPESDTVTAHLYTGDAEGTFQVLILQDNGLWEPVECHSDGRYVLFDIASGTQNIALVKAEPFSYFPWICGAGLIILGVIAFAVIRKKKA